MPAIAAIYEIVNIANGRRYVGSAVNFKRRWSAHINALMRGTHHARHLQRAWNKHGASAFRFRVLRVCAPCYLIPFEQHYLDRLGAERSYNSSPTAGSQFGLRHTPQTKAKMSATRTGVPRPPETRARIAAAHTGRKRPPFSDEWRANLVASSSRGKKRSPEHCANISAALKAWYAKNAD